MRISRSRSSEIIFWVRWVWEDELDECLHRWRTVGNWIRWFVITSRQQLWEGISRRKPRVPFFTFFHIFDPRYYKQVIIVHARLINLITIVLLSMFYYHLVFLEIVHERQRDMYKCHVTRFPSLAFQISVFGVSDVTARIDVSSANWMLNIFAAVYLLCNVVGINGRAMTSITVLVRLDWWHAIEYTLTSVKCSHGMLVFIRWTHLV